MSNSRKFKGDILVEGDIQLPNETASRVIVIDGSGELASSATTTTELSYLEGVTSSIQDQLDAAQTAADDAQQAIDDHINDSSDAHDASAISYDNVLSGAIATNVQDALDEVIADENATNTALADHIGETSGAHTASAISVSPQGGISSTDVQAALEELQSDIDDRALDSAVIKKDGSVAFTANQSMGGFNLTGLAAPSAGSDAATKDYVDNALEGLKPKAAVRVATTVAGVLLTSFEDGDVIDGVTLATGDRILIKDQVLAAQNGIYIVQASGAPVRSTDFDSVSPIDEINKAFVATQEGTANAGKIFVQYGVVAVIGTDDINFTFFNSVSGLTGGDGITVSGSNIEVDHDGEGLTFVATQLALELDGSTLSKSASGLKLSDTAVTPGSIGSATETVSITVDQQGRLTSASEQSIAIPASQVTDFNEAAQDAVGTILVDSATIDLSYVDATPSISAAVITQLSITSDASGVKLVNDASTPGNSYYYGTNGSGTKGYFPLAAGSAGDISETSFSAANNQASAANVTGLAFANATVRSFSALVSVTIDATADLFEEFNLQGIQRGSDWMMSVDGVGDSSGIVFSITSAGQIQYTSTNLAGFVSNTIKFRAWVTTV